ncbi:uncharacterized protein FOMMEDRAFT_164602 [Fomitiporia mediterranea MF3/22]|uniref:uncharacterized protein n=1 Tax=Fomitiporia mediterranea (strain MF3/22) TaxID=694068 RepID=UPI00044075E3|nr:uncharacterized protein FOMMEDRAFT_164602 [Fomitiporia mediterranea MF3/22]EJD07705.1 hypothetical protein FOMMEDRAFT_164602 [Fomitiporia mediterranea MF3/22]
MYRSGRPSHTHSGAHSGSSCSSSSQSQVQSRDLFSAYEPSSGTYTPFPTAADALIARLRLESGLGVPTVNLFLDILHHPEFKLDELTVTDTSDIDLEVAKHRSNVRRLREQTIPPSTITSTIGRGSEDEKPGFDVPYPVLERILDAISTDTDLVDEPLQYQIPLVDAMERQRGDCLRNMALVHRSWTIPSQQRLAARMVARSPSALLRLLRSPLPGTHTRELVVALGDVWNNSYRFEGTESPVRPGDVETDLCSLLKRLPRLRSLTLKESGLREDLLLPVISDIKTLESLSWHCAHGYPSCDFAYLADALRRLPNLTALEISGWSFHAASGITGGPPLRRQLNELRICISPGDMQLNRVGWLLQALKVDAPTKLTLDITLIGTLTMAEVFRTYPGAQEALATLHTLHLINKGGFVEFNLAQARTLLQACSSVRKLHIQGQTAPITEFLDILPSTTEELCFSWFDMWMSPWNLVERHLPELVRTERMNNLKRIVVYNYEVPFYRAPVEEDGEPVSHPCPDAQEACSRHGIELDLWSKPPDWRNI